MTHAKVEELPELVDDDEQSELDCSANDDQDSEDEDARPEALGSAGRVPAGAGCLQTGAGWRSGRERKAITKEALWLRTLHKDVAMTADETVTVGGENQAMLKVVQNPVESVRTKHVDVIYYHFVRPRGERRSGIQV